MSNEIRFHHTKCTQEILLSCILCFLSFPLFYYVNAAVVVAAIIYPNIACIGMQTYLQIVLTVYFNIERRRKKHTRNETLSSCVCCAGAYSKNGSSSCRFFLLLRFRWLVVYEKWCLFLVRCESKSRLLAVDKMNGGALREWRITVDENIRRNWKTFLNVFVPFGFAQYLFSMVMITIDAMSMLGEQRVCTEYDTNACERRQSTMRRRQRRW